LAAVAKQGPAVFVTPVFMAVIPVYPNIL
jgi:hypothetical protein